LTISRDGYACGIPVIATPVGAIPEIVGIHGPGWLTRNTTAEAIAERMTAFLRGCLVSDRSKLRHVAGQLRREVGLARLTQILLPEGELDGS